MKYYTTMYASTYGSGTYNSSSYNGATSTSTGSGSSGSAGGSILTNTGFDIAAAATLATVIIFTALVTRFWKRPAKPTAPSEQ